MIGWQYVLLCSLGLGLCLSPLALDAEDRPLRAGRDVNRIENPSGPAVIQTDKGTIIIQNITQGIAPEIYAALAKQLGVTEQALATFFATIERQKVPLADLDATLRQIAEHYKALLERLRLLSSDDPEVSRLRDEAKVALEVSEFDRAERLLNEASAQDQAAAKALEAELSRMQTARKQRLLSAAAAKTANGDLKNSQLAYAEAAAYYGEAVALVPEEDLVLLATYLNAQGRAFSDAGRYPEARPPYERALAVREKVLGLEHPQTATSLNNLGYLLAAQGELAAARPYYERALAIREQVLGPEHPQTAGSLNNLASLSRSQGRYAEAIPLYRQVLAIETRRRGADHTDTLGTMNTQAQSLFAQGEVAEARQLQEHLLATHQRLHGPEHDETLISMNNLAKQSLLAQGELERARQMLEQVLATQRQRLGSQHLLTLIAMHNLAEVLRAQGELAVARALLEEALTTLC